MGVLSNSFYLPENYNKKIGTKCLQEQPLQN